MTCQTLRRWQRRLIVTLMVCSSGTVFGGLSSCYNRAGNLTRVFNPCGTIFDFCEPEDIDLLFAEVPDWDVDPTCTIPGACGDPFPIFPVTPGERP